MKMKIWYDKLKGAITSINAECTRVLFQVFDKEDKSLGVMEADFGDLPDLVQAQVSLYGLNKLLTDRTSDVKNKLEKLAAMKLTFEQLMGGEWAKERTVGAIVVGVEVEALAQLKELTVPAAQKALAEYDKETRKKILGSEAVQKLAAEIREERAATEVASLDDMIPSEA